MKKYWRIWALSLGEKATDCDNESDQVALVRSVVVLINLVTCCFIIANAIHHW